jgi:PPE-repeat protein
MLAAAAAWDGLAAELGSAAVSYSSVISGLTAGSWQGPSSASMAAAAAPYVAWLHTTAAQAEQTAGQARAAAGAFETAFAMTVPPPLIAANRAQLMLLIATNVLGQNAPAIAATEAQYGEMWAQDAAAMYGYAGSSAAASTVTPFSPPQPTTNPAALASQGTAAAQGAGTAAATNTQATLSQLTSAMPQALQSLTSPTSSTSSTSALSSLSDLKSAMYPLSMMSMMPMRGLSMVNMLKSLSSTTSAASKGFTTAAPALTSGIGPGVGALGSTPGLGGGTLAVSGGIGRAVSIGPLSVPQAWSAAAAPLMSPVAAELPGSSVSAAPVSGPAGMPLMPIANMAGRVPAGATPQYDMRPTVIPRSPSAG